MIPKPISISLSPNTEKDDIFLAFKLLFQPWNWKIDVYPGSYLRLSASTILEEEFKKYLEVKYAIFFNSGRSALMAILNSLGLEKNDEVLLQAFTCNAAVNPIIWSKLEPVFVDCNEETLNIEIEDLKRKITSRSRVVTVQHTFGLPAEMDEILEICRKNNLILIEDCAHSLGATYKGKKIGTFGKAAFFSFGRDKIISSVYGGMAVTNDPSLAEKLRQVQGYPSYFWIFQQLLHPILINYFILPLYNFLKIGRLMLYFFQKIKILSKAVSEKEKKGENPSYFPKRLPNALAILALNQFKKLERFISHQKEIAKFYNQRLKNLGFILPKENPERVYMRYSILIENGDTDKILKMAREKRIFLDDGWRKTAIVPPDTVPAKMKYNFGSCPKAERLAKSIINLPTHINITQKEAQGIVEFLNSCK